MILVYPATIDSLPEDAGVVNLDGRDRNYALFGNSLRNRVISFSQARQLFYSGVIGRDSSSLTTSLGVGQRSNTTRSRVGERWNLSNSTLRDLGASHVYVTGTPEIAMDDCLQLTEVERLDRSPLRGSPLPFPGMLYSFELCDR